MKITLISTSTYPSDQGIRTISALLKNEGHKVTIVFMALSEDYTRNYTKSELIQLAKICNGSHIIGINSFASTTNRTNRVIHFLRRLNIPMIYGGVHATICPEDCITHSDVVCVGEGEGAVVDFVKAIENKEDYSRIKNLWVKKDGKIIRNPVRDVVDDIDTLPFLDYEIETHYILENKKIRKFQEKDLGGQIFFLTGRGCPYGCDYCSNCLFNELYEGKRKRILRLHSPEYIIRGILFLKKKFPSLSYFDIRDDTFSLRPLEDIKKFCELYKEKVNMSFKCLGDPKTISEEKVCLLVNAGCTDIIIGIQGSEKTNREIYHRAQTDEQVLNAARVINKFKDKLTVMYDVITCNPYEKPEDIINLIRLLQRIPKPYFLSVNNLVFFPGTKLDKRARQDGIIKKEKDAAYQLNYWDRSAHILLKRKNEYLVLILNLMRGIATEKRFGVIPNWVIRYLLKRERVQKNLKNPLLSLAVLRVVSFYDLIREKILKPTYRSLPLDFRIWYGKTRYRQ